MTQRAWEVGRGVLVVIVSSAVISAAVSLYQIASRYGPLFGSVPSGAVVPFDSVECPAGWRQESRADGRFIVGTGLHLANENGIDLAPFELRDRNGSRTHALTIQEMPNHGHRWLSSDGNNAPASADANPNKFGAMNFWAETEGVGENAPHNNLPPYLALEFCIKE